MINKETLVSDTEENQTISDEEIARISEKLIEKNIEAYKELSK